jgi:hypothetical protein
MAISPGLSTMPICFWYSISCGNRGCPDHHRCGTASARPGLYDQNRVCTGVADLACCMPRAKSPHSPRCRYELAESPNASLGDVRGTGGPEPVAGRPDQPESCPDESAVDTYRGSESRERCITVSPVASHHRTARYVGRGGVTSATMGECLGNWAIPGSRVLQMRISVCERLRDAVAIWHTGNRSL